MKGRVVLVVVILGIVSLIVSLAAYGELPKSRRCRRSCPGFRKENTIRLYWGRFYPLQYKSWLKSLETSPSPTGYGGSVNFQHSTRQPEILINFKGMPFSKDYSEDRGHPYALGRFKQSKRVTAVPRVHA